jgi:tetratricopeptide (TPR) repeat protein
LDQHAVSSIAGLAIELVTDLQLFDDIQASYLRGDARDGNGQDYQLTGIARQEGGLVRVTASLRRSGSDVALWTFTQQVSADQLETSIDDLSQVFAEQLGSHRGPLFIEANRWLGEHPNISGNETVFLCGLLFTHYRDDRDLADEARARDCVSSVLARGEDALALAMRAGMLLDDTVATQPLNFDPEPLAETGRLLTEALKLDATSSTIWREQARYLNRLERISEAEAAYASALQLNPANLDARAGYGRMLSGRGDSAHGRALAEEALQHALSPPHWYYAAPALNALRDGQDALAIQYADRLASGDSELAAPIATVAAFRSSNEDALNRYFAQLLDVTRFRRFGILPVLRQRIPDPALVDLIATQLKRAGVADDVLNSGNRSGIVP